MPTDTEYFITPRIPGVRPKDPPDYDGYVFVYVFTRILDPWIVPPVTGQVVVVVDNSQGFVPGMTIAVEWAGTYQVVDASTLNRLTIENLDHQTNAPAGTTIPPGNLTTTSLPGPKGDQGDQGDQGIAATVDVGTTTTSPAGQNANVVNSGTQQAAIFNFTIPRGPIGPQGAQGAPGQAFNTVTAAAFTAAASPTLQTLTLSSTTGLFQGVVLNIDPIGYYEVQSVISGTQCVVKNTGTATNAPAGTVAPSGSPVLGTGPAGPPGIAATIDVGTTATGAPGTQAQVTQRGTAQARIFDFAIPRGDVGPQGQAGVAGANGQDGAAATIDVGTTVTGAPGTQAAVTERGTPQARIFDFVIPRGDVGATGIQGPTGPQGPAGANGAAGADATVNAGTTSTGAPGTNALVTQRGTPGARIFDFTIPRGDVGSQGPTGIQGNPGIPAFTITAAGFTVPPVGQTVNVNLQDASWVVIGQMVAVQTAGGAQNAGTLQVTGKAGNQITLLNAPGSVIPVADATQDGLLRKVSGANTDYINGTNHSVPMGPVIIGGPAGTLSPPSGIIVPRYANHPDAIWTPLSSLDDHFDAPTIDPKWTLAIAPGMINTIQAQAGSHLSLGGISPSGTDGVYYNNYAVAPLPNSNNFTLTVKARVATLSNYGTSGSWGFAWFRIQTAGSAGAEWRFGINCAVIATSPSVIVFQNLIWGYAGTNFGTQSLAMAFAKPPEYWRIVYDNAAKTTAIWVSDDGQSFQYLSNVAGATSGFSTAPPTRAYLGLTGINLGRGIAHFDWIRFTNP